MHDALTAPVRDADDADADSDAAGDPDATDSVDDTAGCAATGSAGHGGLIVLGAFVVGMRRRRRQR